MFVGDGVGDDRVESPVPGFHVLEQRIHLGEAGCIRFGAEAARPDLLDGPVESLLLAPVTTTVAPCATNSLAIAKPIPVVPPVMTATFLRGNCSYCLLWIH